MLTHGDGDDDALILRCCYVGMGFVVGEGGVAVRGVGWGWVGLGLLPPRRMVRRGDHMAMVGMAMARGQQGERERQGLGLGFRDGTAGLAVEWCTFWPQRLAAAWPMGAAAPPPALPRFGLLTETIANRCRQVKKRKRAPVTVATSRQGWEKPNFFQPMHWVFGFNVKKNPIRALQCIFFAVMS
jgi:hypothetical protein